MIRMSSMIHLLSESLSRQRVVICATMRDICPRLSLGQVSRMVGLAYHFPLIYFIKNTRLASRVFC